MLRALHEIGIFIIGNMIVTNETRLTCCYFHKIIMTNHSPMLRKSYDYKMCTLNERKILVE